MKKEKMKNQENLALNNEGFDEDVNEEVKKSDWFINDRKNFLERYPDVNCEELFTDKFFLGYASGKVGDESMAEIYASYLALCAEIEKKVLAKAEQDFAVRLAKAKATPGSLTENTPSESRLFTLDELKGMTPKEIEQNWDKVQKSLKNLRKEK